MCVAVEKHSHIYLFIDTRIPFFLCAQVEEVREAKRVDNFSHKSLFQENKALRKQIEDMKRELTNAQHHAGRVKSQGNIGFIRVVRSSRLLE